MRNPSEAAARDPSPIMQQTQEDPMTAITMQAGSPTRLRLTRRGRRVLAGLCALPLAGALSLAAISGGDALASRVATSEASFASVTVLPGDSLWSLAQRVAPSVDPRDAIDAIARLNALDSSTVRAGQVLSIPSEYTS